MVYVSITGLRLKRFWHYPRFAWHAARCMAQAKGAPGNLRAEARTINGIHHTLSVWTDRDAMLAYVTSGAHVRAMPAFRSMAVGKVLGFEAAAPPAWADVHGLWQDKGRSV